MSVPSPGNSAATQIERPPARPTSPVTGWLIENALVQSLNGTIWASLLGALAAMGASMAAATGAAVALCIAFPVIGWFFGLPIVLAFAMMAAALWFTAVAGLICAWGCTALMIAAVTVGRRLIGRYR